MATSKLLKPTNVTISIPEFTDQPDQRVNSNCLDKEADAINSLSEQMTPIYRMNDNFTFTNGVASLVFTKNVHVISAITVASHVPVTVTVVGGRTNYELHRKDNASGTNNIDIYYTLAALTE